jgi:Tfp pilus assembly protein FimT
LNVPAGGEGGFSLLEAALALLILGLLLAASGPALFAALSRGRVSAAARELGQEMARLRSEAIASRRKVAMRLTWSAGHYAYAFYADGDGDGVRADDIAAGRDPSIGVVRDLVSRYDGVDFGLLDVAIPEVPPDTGVLPPGADPVRFGRSDIITFTPYGTSSSGTLYVSDGTSAVAAVVLFGGTGRIRTLRFDREVWAWRR